MIDAQITSPAIPSPRPAGVSSWPAASAATGLVANPGADLTKTDFLTLMITQLRMQDPLDPLDQDQFLAQTAQFSSLEQLVTMNETLAGLAAGLSATPEPSASLAQLQQIAQALDDIKGLLAGGADGPASSPAGQPPAPVADPTTA